MGDVDGGGDVGRDRGVGIVGGLKKIHFYFVGAFGGALIKALYTL